MDITLILMFISMSLLGVLGTLIIISGRFKLVEITHKTDSKEKK